MGFLHLFRGRRGRPFAGAALAVLVLVVAGVGLARADRADAHAVLESTEPADGASLDTAPDQVVLRFSESVQTVEDGIQVYEGSGDTLDVGQPAHPGDDGAAVAVDLPDLPEGAYVVAWRVVSSDSHPISGAFTFQVGDVDPAEAEALRASLGSAADSGGDDTLGIVYGVARFAGFAGLVLLVGGSAFVLGVWPRGVGDRRVRRLVTVGWGVAVVATVACIGLQGAYGNGLTLGDAIDPSVIGDELGARAGRVWLVRLLLLAVVAAAGAAFLRRFPAAPPPAAALAAAGPATGASGPGEADGDGSGEPVAVRGSGAETSTGGSGESGAGGFGEPVAVRATGTETSTGGSGEPSASGSGEPVAVRRLGTENSTGGSGESGAGGSGEPVAVRATGAETGAGGSGGSGDPVALGAAEAGEPVAVRATGAEPAEGTATDGSANGGGVTVAERAVERPPAAGPAGPVLDEIRYVGSLLGLALLATITLAGHAGAGRLVGLAIATDIVHLAGVSLWLGGLAVLTLVLLRRDTAGLDRTGLERVVARFSTLAFLSVVAIAASGVVQAWRQLETWSALTDTAYGRLLLVKVALVAAMLVAAGFSRAWLRGWFLAATERAAGARASGNGGKGHRSDLYLLRQSVGIEALIAIVVLAVTAALVQAAPEEASAAGDSGPFQAEVHGANVLVDVGVEPTAVGPVDVDIQVAFHDGTPMEPEEVSASLSLPERDLGPLDLELEPVGTGRYRSSGADIPFPGEWELEVVVRTSDIDQDRLTAPFSVD